MTHSAALKDCESKGMRLVSIETLKENEFLKEEQDHMHSLWWTGAVLDPETKAYWKWGSNGSLWSAHGTKTAFGEIGKPGLVSPTSFGWVWRSIAWPCSQPGDGETGGVGKNCGLYVKLKKSQRIN